MTAGVAEKRIAHALFAAVLSAVTAPNGAAGEGSNLSQLRQVAETMAKWGIENDAPRAVLAGLAGLLDAGVSLEPDDPWHAFNYAEKLRDMAVSDPVLSKDVALQLSQSRGVIDGISRIDAIIEPEENLTVILKMAHDETAIVEARIKQGGEAADVDLIVTSGKGEILASDVGPETGIAGTGALVHWFSEKCESVQVVVSNAGLVPAPVVMMAPPSPQNTCDPNAN